MNSPSQLRDRPGSLASAAPAAAEFALLALLLLGLLAAITATTAAADDKARWSRTAASPGSTAGRGLETPLRGVSQHPAS